MLLTFGHGAASAEQIITLLRGAWVSVLVDVRTAPGSRRHPHVALDRAPGAGTCCLLALRTVGQAARWPAQPGLNVARRGVRRGCVARLRRAHAHAVVPGRGGRRARPGQGAGHGGDVRLQSRGATSTSLARRLSKSRWTRPANGSFEAGSSLVKQETVFVTTRNDKTSPQKLRHHCAVRRQAARIQARRRRAGANPSAARGLVADEMDARRRHPGGIREGPHMIRGGRPILIAIALTLMALAAG